MGKTIKLTEDELHRIIRSKIQEALEHNVDLEYSPAIGNKKRGPGKDTMDQMKKRRNTKLDEGTYGFEMGEKSGMKTIEISDRSYELAFEDIYGKAPGNLAAVLEDYGLPESVSVRFNMSSRRSKGDYEVPGYTDYDVEDWEIDHRELDGIYPEMVDVVKKAVEYEIEGSDTDDIASTMSEGKVRLTFDGLHKLISECVKRTICTLCEEDEEAVSKSQQRLFGMVDAYKKGEMKNAPKKIRDIADGMSMKDVKDFAETKHKGLPNRVKKSKK